MKKIIYILFFIGILTSCTDKFAEINTDPEVGVPPAEFLFTFLSINLLLMLFNLIPLAPLDGEKVLSFLLPAHSPMANHIRKCICSVQSN